MRKRVCAAIIRQSAILMVHHQHQGRDYWTLPGGGIEDGETPEQAVLREVYEETGLRGEVLSLLYRRGRERCYLVQCPPEQAPIIGRDPELGAHDQILTGVAWFPLHARADDLQVRLVLAALRRAGKLA